MTRDNVACSALTAALLREESPDLGKVLSVAFGTADKILMARAAELEANPIPNYEWREGQWDLTVQAERSRCVRICNEWLSDAELLLPMCESPQQKIIVMAQIRAASCLIKKIQGERDGGMVPCLDITSHV